MLLHNFNGCKPFGLSVRQFAVVLLCQAFLLSVGMAQAQSQSEALPADQKIREVAKLTAAASENPDELPSRLPQGSEVVIDLQPEQDSSRVNLSASLFVAGSPEKTWAVLVDCDHAMNYVPAIRECEVLQSGIDPHGITFDITRHRIKPYFFLPSVENIFRANYNHPESIEFYRQGGDLMFFRGSWRFFKSMDGQTLVHYQAQVDLHKRLNQRAEMRRLRRDVPKMLKSLRKQVENSLQQ